MHKIGYNHELEEIAGCYIFGTDIPKVSLCVTQSTEALLNGSISKKWLRTSIYRHNSLVIGFSLSLRHMDLHRRLHFLQIDRRSKP